MRALRGRSVRPILRLAAAATLGLALLAGGVRTFAQDATPAAALPVAGHGAAGHGAAGHGAAARAKPTPPVLLAQANASAPARIVTPGIDSPNPFVLQVGATYYMYSSQYSIFGPNIPLRSSGVLTSWSSDTDAMPNPPAWVERGYTWSPDVRRVGDHYVMWFSGALAGRAPLTKCIGVATSASPRGPFVGLAAPTICQLDHNGDIDPRTFRTQDGSLWLDWKSDDNADVNGTSHSSIYAQRLAANGQALVGAATVILTADQPWEGRIVEAPQMIEHDGGYWLFYSANWFNEPYYGIGVAECQGPAGPCHKYLDRPWLSSNAQGSGPGEASLFTGATGTWILYSPTAVHYRTYTARPVALARVGFGPFGPYLAAF